MEDMDSVLLPEDMVEYLVIERDVTWEKLFGENKTFIYKIFEKFS